jgi:hypothetical protein
MQEVLADGVVRLRADPDLVVAELGRASSAWCSCADVVVCTSSTGVDPVGAWLAGLLLLGVHRGACLAVVRTPAAVVLAFRTAG